MSAFELFEAEIVRVDFFGNTCSLRRIHGASNKVEKGVPLPQQSGSEDYGCYTAYSKGTRVLAIHSPSISRNAVSIVCVYSNNHLQQDGLIPMDIPTRIHGNPKLGDGARSIVAALRGGRGSEIQVSRSGDIHMRSGDNLGVSLFSREWGNSLYSTSHTIVEHSNAHSSLKGTIMRVLGDNREAHETSHLHDNPIGCDFNQDNPAGVHEVGMFALSRASDVRGVLDYSRNPRRSEYVLKINEYSEQSLFTGYDDEVSRAQGEIDLTVPNDTHSRNKKPGNRLHMSENQLIEIVAGSLVDINCNVLDINYNSVVLGSERGTVPVSDQRTPAEIIGIETKLKSRREIGYHFQLSTNICAADPSSSTTNFTFDVDKEGVLKVNIPKSSSTGNIPFASTADYLGPGDVIKITYDNPSKKEPIPITLWGDVLKTKAEDESGVEVSSGVFRKVLKPSLKTPITRFTGVDFLNSDQNPYFPPTNDGDTLTRVRVNTTKYHNMYAAAEKLIANRIESINICKFGNRSLSKNSCYAQQFEVMPITSVQGDGQTETNYPSNRTVAIIESGEPAINPAGFGTIVSGGMKSMWQVYSNAFTTTVEDGAGSAQQDSSGFQFSETLDPGGRSANINLEGSLEMSVGSDNYDQKSIVLDTAGSLIAWLGKDRNGRSAVVQTDGEVLINIGGSYGDAGHTMSFDDPESDKIRFANAFNSGRFDLRVNVNHNGFLGTGPANTNGNNKPYAGDYLISISESGLVIAGCNTGAPMVIRNDGDINIEATNKLTLYGGTTVEIVDGHQQPKTQTGGSGKA